MESDMQRIHPSYETRKCTHCGNDVMEEQLKKHGIWNYCSNIDCVWFSNCGLAVTQALYRKSLKTGKELSYLEHCVDYKSSQLACKTVKSG